MTLLRPAKAWLIGKLRAHGEAIVYRAAGLPIALRSAWCDPGCPRDILRAAYIRHYRSPERMSEWLDLAIAAIILVPGVLFTAARATARNGTIVARASGKSPARQLREQVMLSFRHGVLPPWYYIFELHEPRRACEAASFIGRAETKEGAYRILARHSGASSPLADKLVFAAFCARHGLPAVQPIAVARRGLLIGDAPALPAGDLFVKPVRASGGSGAWRLVRQPDGRYRASTGEMLSAGEMLVRFAARSAMRPMLLQPCLANHPALADLANGALATVRLLTCLDEQAEPEVVGAVLRMAVGVDRIVDNLHAGGLAASVALDGGLLGAATTLGTDVRIGRIDRHPTTGARIAGRRLPHWREVMALGVRAHRAFADHVLVGWDIAILSGGPTIVEGNSGPDLDIMQRTTRRPLGAERLAALLAHHLQAAGAGQAGRGRPARLTPAAAAPRPAASCPSSPSPAGAPRGAPPP